MPVEQTLGILAILICSGMFCLGVAVALLGGVVYVLRNASDEDRSSLWPFSSASSSHANDGLHEPSLGLPPPPLVAEPVFEEEEEDKVTEYAPRGRRPGSGQTIIAFGDDDDD